MDMAKSVYGLPPEELAERIERAFLKAKSLLEEGRGDDPLVDLYHTETAYLGGAALAIREGKKPPFLHGTRVMAKVGVIRPLNFRNEREFPVFPVSVIRVYYCGGGEWLLEIDGFSNSGELYAVEDFEVSEG